jgi:hypothetical protein
MARSTGKGVLSAFPFLEADDPQKTAPTPAKPGSKIED